MTRTVSRIADRLVSMVVPQTTASAAWLEYYCGQCDQWRRKQFYRLCDQYSCSGWYSNPCGSC